MTGVTKLVPTAFAADEVLVLVHGRGGSQALMDSIEGDIFVGWEGSATGTGGHGDGAKRIGGEGDQYGVQTAVVMDNADADRTSRLCDYQAVTSPFATRLAAHN